MIQIRRILRTFQATLQKRKEKKKTQTKIPTPEEAYCIDWVKYYCFNKTNAINELNRPNNLWNKNYRVKGIRFVIASAFCEVARYICRDLPTNVNRSDYSLALEKLHPGTAENDKALFTTLTSGYSQKKKKGIN